MNETPIELVPYDPEWQTRFERERERLRDIVGDHVVRVFHIGSTAVPGLPAKPIVDVCPVCSDMVVCRTVAKTLEDARYAFGFERQEWIHLGHEVDGQRYNIHLRPGRSEEWRKNLLLREFLRDNAPARREYARVKREAAREHTNDVEAYSEAKSALIDRFLERARSEGYMDQVPDLDEDPNPG